MARKKYNRNTILNYIKFHLGKTGFTPTVREIAREFNIPSTATVHDILVDLEMEGEIIFNPTRSKYRLEGIHE